MNNTRDFVNKARYALGMTQEDFADAIGCSSRTVRRWETGQTDGTISNAIAIIKLCKDNGVEIDTIVFYFVTDVSINIL